MGIPGRRRRRRCCCCCTLIGSVGVAVEAAAVTAVAERRGKTDRENYEVEG